VSSTEKMATKRDITRVMVKTWMWTVTVGHVSWMDGNRITIKGPKVRGNKSEQDISIEASSKFSRKNL